MRVTTILAGLIAAIEAITPDDSAGEHDKLRHVKEPDPDTITAKDRTFLLIPDGGPVRDGEIIQATNPMGVEISFALAVGYTVTPRTMSRILQDGERILDAVLAYQLTAGVFLCELTDSTIVPDEAGLVVESRVRVIYQLDALT